MSRPTPITLRLCRPPPPVTVARAIAGVVVVACEAPWPPSLPLHRSGADLFDELVLDAVEHLETHWASSLSRSSSRWSRPLLTRSRRPTGTRSRWRGWTRRPGGVGAGSATTDRALPPADTRFPYRADRPAFGTNVGRSRSDSLGAWTRPSAGGLRPQFTHISTSRWERGSCTPSRSPAALGLAPGRSSARCVDRHNWDTAPTVGAEPSRRASRRAGAAGHRRRAVLRPHPPTP